MFYQQNKNKQICTHMLHISLTDTKNINNIFIRSAAIYTLQIGPKCFWHSRTGQPPGQPDSVSLVFMKVRYI